MANPVSNYIYRQGTAPNTRAAVSQKNKIFGYLVGKNAFQHSGAISEFSYDESRTVETVRGIGFGDQVAELVPSVTEPMTLSVNHTLLYTQTLFQLMGYKGGVDGLVRSLKHHRWPFDIKKELVFSELATLDDGASSRQASTQPGSAANISTSIKALVTYFEGCWFNSISASSSADSALIAENSSITVTDIVDGLSTYGEYIDSGLSPFANGAAPGAGASIRFAGGTQPKTGI